MATTRTLNVTATVQLFCYSIAWCCVWVFIIAQFAMLLPGWTWVYDDPNNVWAKFQTVAWISWYNLIDNSKLFEGWDMLMLVFTWLPAILAPIIALVPVLVISKAARKASWQTPTMTYLTAMGRKVHRAVSYPMWPHSFWLWYCNGLSVWDAFIWVGFLVLHLLGVAYMTQYYEKRAFVWDALGFAYPAPKSVLRLRAISLAFSWVLMMDVAMLFFPAAHVSFLHTLMGSSWQAMIRYHRWIGHYTMWTTTGHGLFYYFYWLADTNLNFWDELFDWNKKSSINFLAGTLSFVFGLALWFTSINWVRRRFFKMFYITHIVGFIGYVLFAVMHYNYCWMWFAPGLILYALDVAMRVFQAQHICAVSCVSITPSGGLALLDIPLADDMEMKAGQDVFLQFPCFSRWQWHPFTIYKVNAATEPGMRPSMTIAIKKYGRWTKALIKTLHAGEGCAVRVIGPVGGLSRINSTATRLVLFVGGVGASPALATLHHMISTDRRIPTTVIFAARDIEEFTILDEVLLQEANRIDKPWLSILLYDTSFPCKACGRTRESHDQETLEHQSSSSADDKPWKGLEKVMSFTSDTKIQNVAEVTSNKGLSAFGWTAVKSVQPRVLNNWHMLLAILLAWTGGFMGLVQAKSAEIEKWYQVWTIHDTWAIGLMFATCTSVQALGLPAALLLFPVHCYRYWKTDKTQNPVATTASPYINVLGSSKVGTCEGALQLDVRQGRPNIPLLLRDVIAGSDGLEIPVVVAGPTVMMNAVEETAWNMNRTRTAGQPFLHVIREAYEM